MWRKGRMYENEEAVAGIENDAAIIMGGLVWYRRGNTNSKGIHEVIGYFCPQ